MIHRAEKKGNYTAMSNYHLKEQEMSLKSKGLLSVMLSLPETWKFSVAGLAALSHDGKDSVNAALQELECFGYLVRSRKIDDSGRFCGYEYDVYEMPLLEKPCADFPHTETPHVLSTNQAITNSSSTQGIKNNYLGGDTDVSPCQTDAQQVIEEWNKVQGLQPVVRISRSTKRYKSLNARIREYGLDAVLKAVSNITESSFLRGQNKKNWLITFDWFVRPDNFIKVLEGNFSDKRGGAKVGAGISTNTNIYEKIGRVL